MPGERYHYHARDQLVADAVKGLAETNGKQNLSIFGYAEAGRSVTAGRKPLQWPDIAGIRQGKVVIEIFQPEQNARLITPEPCNIVWLNENERFLRWALLELALQHEFSAVSKEKRVLGDGTNHDTGAFATGRTLNQFPWRLIEPPILWLVRQRMGIR